ncbi:Uncharacterised protein [Mycobacteroides abscessus subsp. abscessus]|nr:Uncharacterised protein [Mycobacteroides abscessus subsp. abscessus]SHZ92314.1 Uncharacterised protein [Mycobacteroides abscessus subsp. abscessus]SIB16478.1 Uncharacterised protein [Mycobacteroides abscessus subsp. abscessus]SIE88565.1 Uncharacterised protein [Mycobacteroides abscessus subsp. abscessus]SKD12516.1 Uncharacterised protein [Mycobacteroides abscessus subsp. abscessus]
MQPGARIKHRDLQEVGGEAVLSTSGLGFGDGAVDFTGDQRVLALRIIRPLGLPGEQQPPVSGLDPHVAAPAR